MRDEHRPHLRACEPHGLLRLLWEGTERVLDGARLGLRENRLERLLQEVPQERHLEDLHFVAVRTSRSTRRRSAPGGLKEVDGVFPVELGDLVKLQLRVREHLGEGLSPSSDDNFIVVYFAEQRTKARVRRTSTAADTFALVGR